MDFDIPQDIQDYLDELDRFIDDKTAYGEGLANEVEK